MPLVEAHDAVGPVTVRDHDQRAVGEPKLKIRIACVELPDRGIVLALQTGNGKSSGGEIGDEASPWPMSNPLSEQVVHLGGDRCWNDQRSIGSPQQLVDAS